jgi:hypothetical protein
MCENWLKEKSQRQKKFNLNFDECSLYFITAQGKERLVL